VSGPQAERSSLQQLLETTKGKLEGVSAQLLRREAALAGAEEAKRSLEGQVQDLTERKNQIAARTRCVCMCVIQRERACAWVLRRVALGEVGRAGTSEGGLGVRCW
jgi:chromosome segregation ATPase